MKKWYSMKTRAVHLYGKKLIKPSMMVTHIGGLDSYMDSVLNLPDIPGGKKLIYTQINMPLTAISDFEKIGKTDSFFAELDECCKTHNRLWSADAEKLLLKHHALLCNGCLTS